MKRSLLVLVLLTNAVLRLAHAAPLSTAFTYQSRLTDSGQIANGTYDFQFRLFDAPTNGAQVPLVLGYPTVAVSNGLFTTGLDFGNNVFNGTTYSVIGGGVLNSIRNRAMGFLLEESSSLLP